MCAVFGHQLVEEQRGGGPEEPLPDVVLEGDLRSVPSLNLLPAFTGKGDGIGAVAVRIGRGEPATVDVAEGGLEVCRRTSPRGL